MSHRTGWQIWPTLYYGSLTLLMGIGTLLFMRRRPAVAAAPDDEVLSLNLEADEYLYRIRRGSRIVYVSVLYTDIIPLDHRTDGSRVLLKLRNVPKWDEEWATLTIRKGPGDTIESIPDEFKPHGLDLAKLDIPSTRFYNFLDLRREFRISPSLFQVKHGDDTWVLKIAPFRHEISYIRQELSIYSILESCRFPLAPRLMGLVYEETKDRTIGFLMEEIPGEYPGIEDLETCRETIRQLHEIGIIHGDVNKYNFLLTKDGAKIIDFEGSTTQYDEDSAFKEIRSLKRWLEDNSGVGRK